MIGIVEMYEIEALRATRIDIRIKFIVSTKKVKKGEKHRACRQRKHTRR